MRRFIGGCVVVFLFGAQFLDASSLILAQSSRTAPLPIRQAGRIRIFGRDKDKKDQKGAEKTPEKTPSTIPKVPAAQLAANNPAAANVPLDPAQDRVLEKAKRAIDISSRRYLSPQAGHTPWMILHGVLALRQDFKLRLERVDARGARHYDIVNGLDYVTAQNPYYNGNIPNPLDPEAGLVPVQGYWFESTAYGGRAHPYQVMFAYEGHINQSLAILSMCDLPLTQPIVVNDSQRPGMPKTITMGDMLRSAQKTISLGNPYELAWTLWFFSNYLDPEEQWTDMHGRTWSMEQLVKTQVNAPLVVGDPDKTGPPCGGTHALFALACACNSYGQKHGELKGTWIAARNTLNYYIKAAQAGQNPDGSMSAKFFYQYKQMADTYGGRLKSSGHMLEWLMMALPPERLQEPWVQLAIERLADDLINGQNQYLDHEHTGSLYHAVHALVLYRNRIEPPESSKPAEQVVELPPEQRNPAPGTNATPEKTATPGPAPEAPKPAPEMLKPAPGAAAAEQSEATIRLLGPGTKRLTPLEAKPLLKPITNSRETEPLKPGDTPAPPPKTEAPSGDTAERAPLLVPMPPELEKPVPAPKPGPAPGEPKSEGAVVKPLTKEEGAAGPVPLFSPSPSPAKDSPKTPPASEPAKPATPVSPAPSGATVPPLPTSPAAEPAKPASEPLVPPTLPEPTPRKPPSAGD